MAPVPAPPSHTLSEAPDLEAIVAERVLVELHRLQSEFIAVAAHELRTPVAAAKSYAELLLREASAAEPERRLVLERLNAVCDRLTRLTRSLLGASRIQSGALEVARVAFDLGAAVRRAAAAHGGADPSHDLVLGPGLRPGVSALGDPERTEDVLANLLANAARYSPPGSAVTVDLALRDSAAEVSVEDRGPGVPEHERARIFERFTRGAPYYREPAAAGTAPAGGVGLGLYIARAYVHAMGGQIGVRAAPGGGAVFWFTVPTTGSASRLRP